MRSAVRRTVIVVEREAGSAFVGGWQIDQATSVPVGVVPYVKSREDVSVVLRSPELLLQGQPIEFSGYSLYRALRTAEALDSRMADRPGGIRFSDLVASHPVLVSFPPDLTWLAHPDAVTKFGEGLKRVLPDSEMKSTPSDAEKITRNVQEQLLAHPQSYSFWKIATRKDPETHIPLSRYLIEYTLTVASRAKARILAGMVPVIDVRTPNSVWLTHKFNLAFADVVADRVDEGIRAPVYLYTLPINPGVFEADTPSEILSVVERNAQAALRSGLFEGIWVAIRGLPSISLSPGRVNSVMGFLRRLSEVAKANSAALWWSRPGVMGLAGLDVGCAVTSFSFNLRVDDVYLGGRMGRDRSHSFGKVLNPVSRDYWEYRQLLRSLEAPEPGLPALGTCRTVPDVLELQSPQHYRIQFSKPYNVAAMNWLCSEWKSHVRQGETSPGREYLQTFSAPTNQWGLR